MVTKRIKYDLIILFLILVAIIGPIILSYSYVKKEFECKEDGKCASTLKYASISYIAFTLFMLCGLLFYIRDIIKLLNKYVKSNFNLKININELFKPFILLLIVILCCMVGFGLISYGVFKDIKIASKLDTEVLLYKIIGSLFIIPLVLYYYYSYEIIEDFNVYIEVFYTLFKQTATTIQ